jgi:PleD family two-component response regulator
MKNSIKKGVNSQGIRTLSVCKYDRVLRAYCFSCRNLPKVVEISSETGVTLLEKVLLLDPYETTYSNIAKVMQDAGYLLTRIKDKDGLATQVDKDVHLILVDLEPGKSVLDVIAHVRKSVFNHIPVLVLSYVSEREAVIEALDAGASDYIIKPFHHSYLLERIGRILNPDKYADIYTEYVSFNMNELLDIELKRAYRGKSPLSLIMLAFQSGRINRSGDGVSILESVLRDIDTVMRYSSDKVLILLPLTNKEGAAYVMERIQYSLESYDYLEESDARYVFTAASVTFPEDADSRKSLIAMLENKLQFNQA